MKDTSFQNTMQEENDKTSQNCFGADECGTDREDFGPPREAEVSKSAKL
jgi:hypothetical protein